MSTTSRAPDLEWGLWWRALKGVFWELNNNNLGLISAGVAFYGMLAIFPAVGGLIAVWGFFADPVEVASQLELLRGFVPGDAYVILDDQVTALVNANTSTLGWASAVSMGAAIWFSRNGVDALIRGLNAIYRERNRIGLRQIGATLGVTFLLVGVALVALCCVVILPIVMAILPLGPLTTMMIAAVRWVVAISVVVVALGVIYRFGPNRRKARTGWLTPGAFLAVVLWAAISWGFSYYIANFGRYNEIYGALGAVIALLMWLYFSAYSMLLGASFNAELELREKEDSTVGPPRPMGERKAAVADTFVTDG